MLKPKRTIVTGGAGFIGSHLVEALLHEGHEVIVLDNFVTGREKNLQSVKDNPRLTVYKVDITERGKIMPYFKDVDWVFHLAALADVVPSIVTPLTYHGANVNGTIAVLEAAREAKIERLVYTASSSCYGTPHVFPTPETAPFQPMYPYALTKYIGEEYVLHWNKVYALPCVSLQPLYL